MKVSLKISKKKNNLKNKKIQTKTYFKAVIKQFNNHKKIFSDKLHRYKISHYFKKTKKIWTFFHH